MHVTHVPLHDARDINVFCDASGVDGGDVALGGLGGGERHDGRKAGHFVE